MNGTVVDWIIDHIVVVFIIVVVALAWSGALQEREDQDATYCVILEKYNDFTPAEVDELYHFRAEGEVSDRFERLYLQKIKPLPGWRQGDDPDDIRWRASRSLKTAKKPL